MFIWPLIWPSAAENDLKGCFFCWLFYWGGHVHTNWDRKLIFCMNNGLDLYFHNPNQFLRGESPPGNQQIKLGHVTYQIKALEKLYSNMPIKCSFDPLFDRQQLKNTRKLHFWWLFYWESMSIPNVIASWVLVWTLVLSFILKYCRGGGGKVTQPKYI